MASSSEALSASGPLIPRKTFIASPLYDGIFFIFAPLLALAVALALPLFPSVFDRTHYLGGERMRVEFFIAIWTWSHLAAVFFRSHANPEIFALHRYRFTVVPVCLYLGMVGSLWVFVTCAVVGVLWDIYHTSMQNFGIGRIYDSKIGNDPTKGRTLDIWMNHVVYIGPIIAGLSPYATLGRLRSYSAMGWEEPTLWIDAAVTHQQDIRTVVIAAGCLFTVYYLYAYHKLIRNGYRVSPQKILLLVSTGSVSIYAYSFMPPLEALFIANLFHALQYFAIVWWTEKRNLRGLMGAPSLPRWVPLAAYLGVVLLLGLGIEYVRNTEIRYLASLAVLCSLLHFWYDGFVWSVRKKQV
jgi:hypothetical protein